MIKISRSSSSSMIAKGRAWRADQAATRYRKHPISKLERGVEVAKWELPQVLVCRLRLEVKSSERARATRPFGFLVRGGVNETSARGKVATNEERIG
jgi:hypothetical protein